MNYRDFTAFSNYSKNYEVQFLPINLESNMFGDLYSGLSSNCPFRWELNQLRAFRGSRKTTWGIHLAMIFQKKFPLAPVR